MDAAADPGVRAECAFCRMLVSSERGAAQIVSADADTRFYDDVGCLAEPTPRQHRRPADRLHEEKGLTVRIRCLS